MKSRSLQVGALALVAILLAGCPHHPGRHGPRPRLPVVVQPVDNMPQAEEKQRSIDPLHMELFSMAVAS
jgi:hypothetical protein